MSHDAVPVDRVDATTIGFLADTHCKTADDLPVEVYEAFRGRAVGLIVHVGHYGTPDLLDRLAELAPVLATSTALDAKAVSGLVPPQSERISGFRRVIEAGGVRIGVEFDLSGKGFATTPEDAPLTLDGRGAAEVLADKFGGPVDVVVSANTHVDRISWCDDVLLVNPGSPNLPAGDRKGGLGTVAVLHVEDGLVDVDIVDLERIRRGKEGANG